MTQHGTTRLLPAGATAPRTSLARRPSQIPKADRLHAKDVAELEGCSAYTAGRLIRSGQLGKIYGRNARDRWVDRRAYHAWLDRTAA